MSSLFDRDARACISEKKERIILSNMAWVPMSLIPEHSKSRLEEGFTKKQQGKERYGKEEVVIKLYNKDESKGLIGVPRRCSKELGQFLTTKTYVDDIRAVIEADWPEPRITYRDNEQKKFVEGLLSYLKTDGFGGIGQAQGGFGKTICGILLAQKLGLKTLVLVHTRFLFEQWIDRIKFVFGESFKVGKIIEDTLILDSPIVVGMVQTIHSRRGLYSNKVFGGFGLLVNDECHRVGARQWSSVVKCFSAKYIVGLSATPRRKDGLDDVFHMLIGPVAVKSNKVMPKPTIYRILYKGTIEPWQYQTYPGSGKPSFSKLIKVVCENELRNLLLRAHILKAVRSGRRIMVLSDRVHHLIKLCNACQKDLNKDPIVKKCALLVGGVPETEAEKKARLEKAKKRKGKKKKKPKKEVRREMTDDEKAYAHAADAIFCTYHCVSEGFDIPSLDTLFLATPRGDVEQSIYRIRRECDDSKPLIVLDICDTGTPLLCGMSLKRKNYYIGECFDTVDVTV